MAEENLGTAVLSIVVDSAGLEASLNKAKQQIQKTSRELQRSLTAAPINPVTGRTARSERNDPVLAAIQQRRAEQRALQTASGSGLGSFLRDIRAREESEKRITAERAKSYKQAQFAERTLTTFATKRAGLIKAAGTGGAGGGRLGGAISSGIIGGAFPLLFGQGGGAAAGGLIGGVAGGAFGGGGGFAGSLVGTLVGQQLDVFNQLAKALQDPVANFQQLVEASNLSSRGLERYAQTLIDLGQTAQAESLVRTDISRTIDPTTLATANAASEQYARTLADVQERLGAILAGPSSRFVSWLDDIIRRSGLLPGAGQGPAPSEAQNRLGLANRGAGTALGLTGIGIAGISAATGFFPGVVAGAGLAAAGAFQTQVGEGLQEQAASAELLKGVQQEILAVEQKRVTIQRQLISSGRLSESGQAELQLQVDLSNIEAQRARAKESFLARPASTESFQAYTIELESLRLTEQQLKRNNDLRREASAEQARLNASQSALNIQGIQQRVGDVISLRNTAAGPARDRLRVQQAGDAAVADARRRAAAIQNELESAQRLKKTSDVSRLTGNLNEAIAATGLASQEASLSLQEFDEQLSSSQAADRFSNLQSAIQSAQNQAQQAAQGFQAAADRYRSAQQGLAGAQAAAFDYLGPQERANALGRAEDLIQRAGLQNTGGLSAKEIVGVGQLAQGILDAQKEVDSTQADLTSSISALADKDWNVNIAVNGGSATAYGDVVNGALSA